MTSLKPQDLTVVVCGGGHAAHVAAAMFAHQGAKVRMFFTPDHAEKCEVFKKAVEENGGGIDCETQYGDHRGMIEMVSSNAEEVLPGADIFIMIVQAYNHEPILKQIKPYIQPGMLIGAIPGPGGFDLLAKEVLGEELKSKITIFASSNLPWTCRVKEYGKKVELMSAKVDNVVATSPRRPQQPVAEILTAIHKVTKFRLASCFLEATLWPTNAIIHPGTCYGLWSRWNGEPFEEPPLFYEGMDDYGADAMAGLDRDIQSTKTAAEKCLGITLNVPDFLPYMVSGYVHNIKDGSTIKAMFNSHKGLAGLKAPCIQLPDGKWTPNTQYRYFTEDLPHGLCVMRNIAEILGVETPTFDKVITWAQKISNQEFLVDGKIQGKDVSHSGCPARFGITTPEALKKEYMTEVSEILATV